MRKSASIDTEAVLAKTREILEAERAFATYQDDVPEIVNRLSVVTWEEVVGIFDKGMLMGARVDQLKHEYAVLLTGAPKTKRASRAKASPEVSDAGQGPIVYPGGSRA